MVMLENWCGEWNHFKINEIKNLTLKNTEITVKGVSFFFFNF